MISKLLESLYNKIFIGIIFNKTTTLISVELVGGKNDHSSYEKSFPSTRFTLEMKEFIETYTKESPYFYIALLDPSKEQGALPTCNQKEWMNYKDLSLAEHHCVDNRWLSYTSKTDLHQLQKEFSDVGIDFLFSPFGVLEYFFADKIKNSFALFVLIQERFISCAVFEEGSLRFANFLDMELESDYDDIDLDDSFEDEEDFELEDDGIVLDDIDASESLESLDDLGDIEDLDNIDDIDDFADAQDLEEELTENTAMLDESADKNEDAQKPSSFNDDYQRFNLIRESINQYYKSDLYESNFLENIYIADSVGVSSDLRRYLEEDLFFNAYIRNIDLNDTICEMAKKELE